MRKLGVNWLPVLIGDKPLTQTYAVNVWIISESIPTVPIHMKLLIMHVFVCKSRNLLQHHHHHHNTPPPKKKSRILILLERSHSRYSNLL
jgi:hypothetical protein